MKGLVMAISVALALVHPCQMAMAGEWELDDALKQIDKAPKGVKGLTGRVMVAETRDGEAAAELKGGVAVRLDGRMRFDIKGDSPKTYLGLPGRLFIHTPSVNKVVEYPTRKHPDRLAQYAIIGFEPSGTGLLKDFLVSLLEETELGSSSTAGKRNKRPFSKLTEYGRGVKVR